MDTDTVEHSQTWSHEELFNGLGTKGTIVLEVRQKWTQIPSERPGGGLE